MFLGTNKSEGYIFKITSDFEYIAYNLAHIYEKGDGVEKDIIKSIKLYEKAILEGKIDAKTRLIIILRDDANLNLYIKSKISNEKLIEEQQKNMEEQQSYITELEYAPNGVGYQKSKEHFEGLAK